VLETKRKKADSSLIWMESPYSPSFQITDKDGIVNYFNTYGYVVVDNVLSEEDCNLTGDEVLEYLTKRGFYFNYSIISHMSCRCNKRGEFLGE
jgi:hypothetical protein